MIGSQSPIVFCSFDLVETLVPVDSIGLPGLNAIGFALFSPLQEFDIAIKSVGGKREFQLFPLLPGSAFMGIMVHGIFHLNKALD